MRAFRNFLVMLTAGMLLLTSCGAPLNPLRPGASYALAPDLTVRLWAQRPTLGQLQVQIAVIPTGATPLTALVPQVLVIPDGGKETDASLSFTHNEAEIKMLLASAQQVTSILIKDARTGKTAEWRIPAPQPLLGCKSGDECQFIGMPQTNTIPVHP
ncbi:MAG: hypothetical protein M1396_00395 [Chloroflexi bacterium]|nr:hypothetical protein [Chloroflexota bacterium]MCL5947009.1 hypothetical protein [Chloroflexota bacterium]